MTKKQLFAINDLFAAASTYDSMWVGETVTTDEEWEDLEDRFQNRKAMIIEAFCVVWNDEHQKFVMPA